MHLQLTAAIVSIAVLGSRLEQNVSVDQSAAACIMTAACIIVVSVCYDNCRRPTSDNIPQQSTDRRHVTLTTTASVSDVLCV